MIGQRSAKRALFVMLLAALVLVLLVMRPFAEALFLAAVLAMVLMPAQRWLARKLRSRERLSAGLLTGGVVVLVLGPLVAFSAFLVKEAADAVTFVSQVLRQEGSAGLIERVPDPLRSAAEWVFAKLPQDTLEQAADSLRQRAAVAGGTAVAFLGTAVTTTGAFVFQAVMMLLALFFFLINREQLLAWVDDASPLGRGQTRELIGEFRRVARAVFLSSVVTAFVQAVVALAGYYIARVPYPIFFAALTFFVAFIPAIGAASVVVVTALLMLLTGHPISALFLAVWGFVVVGLVDNVVKPLIIRSGMQLHGAVVFFALLGGISAFGPIGLVMGPLAVALFLALLRIYQRDYAEDPRDRQAMSERTPATTAPSAPPPPASTAPPEGNPPLHS